MKRLNLATNEKLPWEPLYPCLQGWYDRLSLAKRAFFPQITFNIIEMNARRKGGGVNE